MRYVTLAGALKPTRAVTDTEPGTPDFRAPNLASVYLHSFYQVPVTSDPDLNLINLQIAIEEISQDLSNSVEKYWLKALEMLARGYQTRDFKKSVEIIEKGNEELAKAWEDYQPIIKMNEEVEQIKLSILQNWTKM